MRWFLIALLACLLGGLWWYLNSVMPSSIWTEHYHVPGVEPVFYYGWGAATRLWPVVLVGVLVGGGLIWLLFGWFYVRAEKADHQREIREWEQTVKETEKHALAEFEERRTAIEELRVQSYQRIERAEQLVDAVVQREQTLDATLAAAHTERDEANQKARNTRFAYERKVKQLAAIQQRLDNVTRGEHV